MKAPVLRLGTITMQYAFSSRSCGIPLSGVAITSEKTAAASPNRLAGALSIANSDVVKTKPATIANFICLCFFLSRVSVATALLVHGGHHLKAARRGPCGSRAGERRCEEISSTRRVYRRGQRVRSAAPNAVSAAEVQVLLVARLLRLGKRFVLQHPRRRVPGALAVRAPREIPGGLDVLAPRRGYRLAAEAEHVQRPEAMANLKLCLRGHLILD